MMFHPFTLFRAEREVIVEMKKISVVLQDKDIREALTVLSEAGVLHLEHFDVPKGDELSLLIEEHDRMVEMLNVLCQVRPRPQQQAEAHVKQMFINISTSLSVIRELDEKIRDYQTELAAWEPWGAFDPREIQLLEKHGIFVRLFAVPEARLKEFPDDLTVETVFISEGIARIIVFSRQEIQLEFDEVAPPHRGINDIKEMLGKIEQQRSELESFVQDGAKYIDIFQQRLKRVEDRIAYQQALTGRGVQDGFAVVQGFCPVDQCDGFEERAKQEEWAYQIDNPSDDDQVPTLLRNPKWVELIKPVFGMINVLPGYKENDISAVFLVFFSVFFGILIGDAGYGLVFALLTGFAHWKFGKKAHDKTPFYLMYILSGMTVLWGVLTGTFLGQTLFPGIKPLVPWLNDAMNVQRLCFLIGAVHLSIAHIWRGILKWPSVAVLAEAGWLCLLWGMFFMARVLVLGDPLAPGAVNLFIAGPALVLFFTKPHKNLLKALGGGLGDLALNVVNTFTDIVSYIRLFAVGLATVAVADAFNVMALGLGFDNIFVGFFTALILVLGHVFNMVLGAMAILVHGLRLNVLEFSSHMNLEWAGVKYSPFRRGEEEKR
jgi:V/A-type H+-transporting ATPase subunit I